MLTICSYNQISKTSQTRYSKTLNEMIHTDYLYLGLKNTDVRIIKTLQLLACNENF